MVILLCYIKALFKNKLDSHECKRLVDPTTTRPNTGKSPPYPGVLNCSVKRKASQNGVPLFFFFSLLVSAKEFALGSSERLDKVLSVDRAP